MKKLLLILAIFLINLTQAQVGINTTNPNATLHIEGDLIIKNVSLISETDVILTIDSEGRVKKIPFALLLPTSKSCPIVDINKSNSSYLLFTFPFSIDNPNDSKIIEGLKFVSAGTWIQNNTYYYSYSNTTGKEFDTKNFTIEFNNQKCKYTLTKKN